MYFKFRHTQIQDKVLVAVYTAKEWGTWFEPRGEIEFTPEEWEAFKKTLERFQDLSDQILKVGTELDWWPVVERHFKIGNSWIPVEYFFDEAGVRFEIEERE